VPSLAATRYGNEVLTQEDVTLRLLTDLLQRLPEALWNTDPTDPTLQQQLFVPIATELARWLEQLTMATKMTLLLEAEGIDLDRLLDDYGLRRYLQRPDPYARQVGMACLFRVKATLTALTRLADLLFDLPHTVLRTGPAEVQVFLADSAPITTPYSYWTVTSRDGRRYAVTVHKGLGWISERPPPGLDVTPAGAQLAGIKIGGDDSNFWYLTVEGDTLHVSRTPPTWGPSDAVGYQVLDGEGQLWTFGVLSGPEVAQPILLSSSNAPLVVLDPAHPFQTAQVVDAVGTSWWLWVRRGIAHLDPTAPVGALNVTPQGGPWRWLRLYGVGDSLWYGFPLTTGIWDVSQATPGGLGTNGVQELGDPDGTSWRLGITTSGTFGVSDTPRVTYGTLATALLLHDRTGKAWYWRIRVPGPIFDVSDTLWPDTVVQMPWGSLGWLAITSAEGLQWYVFPMAVIGNPQVELGPPSTSPWGWREPVQLRDSTGQRWNLSIRNGVLHYEPDLASDLPLRAPALDLRDVLDAYRHVYAAGTQLMIRVS
jgi:hypothetical protein